MELPAPASHSPVALWWWSGEPLVRSRLRWQLERFAAGGVHNLVVINLAPSGPMFGADADSPAFFSPAWWELFDQVCSDAEELGVSLWFYDQLGFSGAEVQARLVRDMPSYAGQWLRPDGSVEIRGFDYLSAVACAELLDRVHGEYERRLGHRLGNVIVGSFQDELPSVPTWSSGFAAEFEARRGYLLRATDLWAEGTPQLRRDYHRTRAELAEEAFFRPLADWHEKHGLLHGCDQQDPARAGHPADGVRLYADYMSTHRWFGAPGSDHHGDARIHSSLAHLYGRPCTWIEAFHSSGWGGTLEETFDWLLPWLRSGATLYNPHAVYYSTKAGWFEWAPPSTDWRQPYWPHHRVFADAVTRLCAVLSRGRHLCDVAVLYPTVTAQAHSSPDGPGPEAARAQEVYRELVGDMAWFQMRPGVLDRLGLDADVIDDDSLHRAAVHDGRMQVADESYAAVILPACTTLDERTATKLAAFAESGGLVVALADPPARTLPAPSSPRSTTPEGTALERLARRWRYVAGAEELGGELAGLRRVEAPVPGLLREVDGTPLLFLPGAAPMASRVSVRRPDERGVDLGWLDVSYDFDPARYQRDLKVRVRGVTGRPVLLGVFGGEPRPLPYERDGDDVEFGVPFDDGPAALIAFPDPASVPEAADQVRPVRAADWELELGAAWDMELVPTLDDTWGDFGTRADVERWSFEHRVEGEDDWRPVVATFGPHGRGPAGAMVYSTSRGIHKDPIHRDVLGPKGHVPEEFLDFGTVPAGEPVTYRTRVTTPEGFLAVGAAAAKTVWLDGVEIPLDDRGHLSVAADRLAAGTYLLEVRLVPDETLRLRGHVAVIDDPASYRRPEWVLPPARQAGVWGVAVQGGVVQVSAYGGCRVLVDGAEVGRLGGFDPYAEQDVPKTSRYTVPGGLLEIEAAGAVLVDGCAVSGPEWGPVRRRQHGDPAALHLTRRPHPLPDVGWLEEGTRALPAVFADPEVGDRAEWLRFTVPPGAISLRVPVCGSAALFVDGAEVARGAGTLTAELEPGGVRTATLRVEARPGSNGGALLDGPVLFEVEAGPIELGDWEQVGLAEYSGGVRYRTAVSTPGGPAVLDLGRVRGTAEVSVDGERAGVRICAPYTFPVTLPEGACDIEVVVYGTLAPYLDAVSPTHFVFGGQRVSGLLGPVRLRAAPPGSG